jgi:hypothetical protein
LKFIVLGMFADLKDLSSAEKDVLFEMAFSELLYEVISGNGLLDLGDGLTGHN